MYTDEVETANPLGSYRGTHKLSKGHVQDVECIVCFIFHICFSVAVFYYMIGNIEPKLRSSLKSIQLVACVTTPLLQMYGYEMVLKPFIHDVNLLSEACKESRNRNYYAHAYMHMSRVLPCLYMERNV